MAVEEKRGCGYRKAGNCYLVGGGPGEPCERLPIPIVSCAHCKRGSIELTRSFQWVGADYALAGAKACAFNPGHCPRCAICQPVLIRREAEPNDEVIILSIGEEHYPTPADWTNEANRLGISRKLSAFPKRLVLGKSWVFVAHKRAIAETRMVKKEGELHEMPETTHSPGIFHAFRPRAVELVVTPSMRKQRWVKDMVEKNGVRLVEVPEDDPDHAPVATKKSARKAAMDRHARKLAKKKPQEARA